MSDPIIRGPKTPLKWSTGKATGYIVEKVDTQNKCDQILIDDEDAAYVTEITGIRKIKERTIEVMPLTGLAGSLPEPGDVFEWGTGDDAEALSITEISESTVKGQPMKWTIKGNTCPGIDLGG